MLASSRRMADEVQSAFPVDPMRPRYLPNPVDIEYVSRLARKRIVVPHGNGRLFLACSQLFQQNGGIV
jgi:hypothetical protein